MASALASVDALALLLGLSDADADTAADLLEALIDQAVALFQVEVDRTATPYQAATTGRVEVLKARGNTELCLDYPIADVTTVKLGLNFTTPDETLDPDDPTVLFWQVGSRTLTRTDGGIWQSGSGILAWARGATWPPLEMASPSRPSFVQVTYDTQADLPAEVTAAVLNLAAQMYRTQGSEGLVSETLDNYSATFAKTAQAVPGWAIAVQQQRRFVAL